MYFANSKNIKDVIKQFHTVETLENGERKMLKSNKLASLDMIFSSFSFVSVPRIQAVFSEIDHSITEEFSAIALEGGLEMCLHE